MSLTSYRAAPPRVIIGSGFCFEKILIAFSRPGSDLLSRVLRRSTIGAGAFHGRVRNGNGCGRPAMTTRSAKGNVFEKLERIEPLFLNTSLIIELMSMNNGNDEVDRAISKAKLHALPHVHTPPINVVVFHGPDREHSFSGGFPA